MRLFPLPLFAFTVLLAVCSGASAQNVQISEFMASNTNGIQDEDGTPQAWVEIWYPNETATQSFSLNNWKLSYGTTSPVTWTFPNVRIAPKQRLLVWLSGKNRRDPTAPLHTDFVVTKDESNLSLLNASGAVVSDLGATFPAQIDNVSYGRDPVILDAFGFYTKPTPNAANNYSGAGVAGKVKISLPSQAFPSSLDVTLEEVTPVPGATIRYTVNGSTPIATSPAYTDPISVTTTTAIRARVFVDGLLPGETETRAYLRLNSSAAGNTSDFSSAMPLVVISSFSGPPVDNPKKAGYMWVFNPGSDGLAKFSNLPDIATRVVLDLRGSSTLGNPKYNLNIESRRNRDDEEFDIPLLGMPDHSDWVFGAPYNFDPSLLHNPFIYALSNRIGRYATRIKEAEVFVKVNATPLSFTGNASGDYFGIYNVGEKIRTGPKRVDVQKIGDYDNSDLAKEGGYIVKVDRRGAGEAGFSVPREGMLAYYYPKEVEIKVPQRTPQDLYIRQFLTDFSNSCYTPNFADPVNGFRKYLDVDAAIDHHLLNVWSFNVDALRLSGYMNKDRGINAKLTYGPIWDFDRSLSSTDGRDANPAVWQSTTQDRGTDFFNYTWWNRLFTDLEFYQRYIDRWVEFRRGEFSQTNIDSLIDQLNAELSPEGVARDDARWTANNKRTWRSPFTGITIPASQNAEVQRLKDYLQQRANFMDSEWVKPVIISPADGNVPPGTEVTLSVADPAPATLAIYYTTDGSDPRPVGGDVPGANAIAYAGGPIQITATTHIRARAYDPNHIPATGANRANKPPRISKWSGENNARFSTDVPAAVGNLVVTELNYHPTGPTAAESAVGPGWDEKDFEFIELRNIGNAPIDLAQAAFTMGISYTFAGSGAQTLGAGEYVIVASNPEAFRLRYGSALAVVGPWNGDLANEGERLVLNAADGSVLVDLTYSDGWYPSTDGDGSSLEYIGTMFTTANYKNPANWRASSGVGGSPGSAGIDIAGSIVINEILSNSLAPRIDAIELFNPTNSAVDIGGWYLSDAKSPSSVESFKGFRIPDSTSIPAGGYLVFTEEDFNPNGVWNPNAGPRGPNEFAFDGDHGDTAVLIEADGTGNLIRFVDRVEFGAAREGVSWGRWPNGTGGLYPMAQQTLLDAGSPASPWPPAGGENSDPRVGPLVISEVHHTPAGDDANLEFVELYNPTAAPQSLANWQLRGDVDFDFIDESLPAGGVAVVTAFDPADTGLAATFRAAYGIGDEITLIGPWDSGEHLQAQGRVVLYRAENPPPLEPAFFPLTVEDETNYSSASPWPVTTDGKSLTRRPELRPGDDPAGWAAKVPAPAESPTHRHPPWRIRCTFR